MNHTRQHSSCAEERLLPDQVMLLHTVDQLQLLQPTKRATLHVEACLASAGVILDALDQEFMAIRAILGGRRSELQSKTTLQL